MIWKLCEKEDEYWMDVDRDDDDDDDGIAKHSFAIIYLHKTVSYPR